MQEYVEFLQEIDTINKDTSLDDRDIGDLLDYLDAKGDPRFIALDAVPAKREEYLRTYISSLRQRRARKR